MGASQHLPHSGHIPIACTSFTKPYTASSTPPTAKAIRLLTPGTHMPAESAKARPETSTIKLLIFLQFPPQHPIC